MKIPKIAWVCLGVAAIVYILNGLLNIVQHYHPLPEYVYVSAYISSVVHIPIIAFVLIISVLKTIQYKQNDSSDLTDLLAQRREGKVPDIIDLMLTNMTSIRKYYSISQLHAQLSFILAVLFSVAGLALITYVILMKTSDTNAVVVGVVGGTISELFAGTALFVHKFSLSQLNLYYQSLHENERFLSTINIVTQMTDGRRDDAYQKIIESSLQDISVLVKQPSER